MSGSRQAKDLIRWAEAHGWSVSKTNGGHLRYTHPDVDTPVFGATSPSDWRAIRNMKARMKRAMRGDPL